jgi:transposase-like protein
VGYAARVLKIFSPLAVESAMGRERDVAKWETWRQRLEEFDRGTAPVAEFCQRLGVSQATFYQWRRRLRPTVTAEPESQTAATGRRAKSRQTTRPLHFLPVEISAAPQIEVLLTGGIRLLLPSHDAQAIRTVLTALLADEREQRPC